MSIQKIIEVNDELRRKITLLENDIDILRQDITILNDKVQILMNRVDPLTIREGFITLEKYIKMEILGSKTKSRQFRDIATLFQDANYAHECAIFMKNHKITIDHIYLIHDVKDKGNVSAHATPIIDRTTFENIALSGFDDDDRRRIKDLLKYLETKNPVDESGTWEIKPPYY